jgi:autotransporter-associated beta strand protein
VIQDGSGTVALTETGTGTEILEGANTYTGVTTINAGSTISISADDNLGTDPGSATPGSLILNGGTLKTMGSFTLNANRGISLVASGGTIDVAGGTTLTYSGIAAGSGSLTDTDGGILVLGGANTYTGTTTINGGTLSIKADNNLGAAPSSATAGSLTLNGGELATTASFTLSANRGISLGASGGTIDVAGGTTLTYNGIAAGTGNLTLTDAGSLALGGANTYTGTTTIINAGTLQAGASSAILSTSDVIDNATLDLDGYSPTIGALSGSGTVTSSVAGSVTLTVGATNDSGTFSGVIQDGGGTVALTKTGTGTETLSGTNTYSGATTINAGTLSIAADSNLGAAPGSATPGSLTLSGGTLATTATLTLNANRGISLGASGGTIDVASGKTLTYSGIAAGTGSLTKTDTGTLVLGGGNSYSGTTTISAGTLSIAADSNLGAAPGSATPGSLILNGGTLATTATLTLNANRGISLGASGGTIDVASRTTLTYGGIVAGAGNLTTTDDGTLVLGGANTYTGTTTINGGTLSIAADNNLGTHPGSATPGSLTLIRGTLTTTASFTLNANRGIISSIYGTIDVASGTTLTDNGIIAGSGMLFMYQYGANVNGTLVLGGANTYTGGTYLYAGTLQLGTSNAIPSTDIVVDDGTLNLDGYSDTIGTLSGSGTVTSSIAGSVILTVGAASNEIGNFSGVIQDGSGTVALTKTGTNTEYLTGANTYSGTTTISGGTLTVDIANAIPSTSDVTDNATLDLYGNSDTIGALSGGGTVTSSVAGSMTLTVGATNNSGTFSGVIQDDGDAVALTKTGTGTETLSGANTYSGTTTINAGTLSIAADDNLGTAPGSATAGSLTLNGGTLATTASFTLNANRGISLGASGGTIDVANGTTLTYSGIAAGSGNLTMTDNGILFLGGANTYGGTTTIGAGTMQVGIANAIPSTSDVTDDGTLNLDGHSDTIGLLGGSGTVTSSVAGTVTLTVGATSHSGTFSGVIQKGSGTVALTKTGTGTETLSGTNAYTGVTTINAGTLSIAADNNLGTAPSSATAGSLTLNGGTLATTATFTLSANRGISLGASNGTIDVAGGTTLTYSGIAAGSGSLTDTDGGILVLGGANTYTGTTTINGGTLSIKADNNLGAAPSSAKTGSVTINGGTLGTTASFTLSANRGISLGASGGTIDVANGTTLTYSGIAAGAGNLTETDTGTLDLGGANTYTGSTTLSAGTLQVGIANAIPSTSDVTDNATLNLDGHGDTIGALSGSGTVTSSVSGSVTLSVGATNDSGAFSGVIQNGSGTLTLTKAGTGVETLSGADTYTGVTTINAGTLSIKADNNLGTAPGSATAGSLTLNGGTMATTASFTLNANRGISLGASGGTIDVAASTTLTYSGIAAGTGSLTKTDTGTLVLGGANIYTGTTTINGGTLSIKADNNLGTAPGSATAGSLTLNGGTMATTASFTLNANRGISLGASGGTIDVAASTTLTYNGIAAGAGNLTETDTGTLVLGHANTYTGSTTISAGTLQVGIANAIPSTSDVTDSATLDLDGNSDAIGALSGSGTVTSSVAGPVTLTVGATNDSGTFTGVIEDDGDSVALTKTGTGTETLSGVNTYAGATTVTAGTLLVNGSLASGSAVSVSSGATLGGGTTTTSGTVGGTVSDSGTISPGQSYGSAGTGILDTGNMTFNSGSSFDVDLNGTTAGSGYDQLNVTGSASLGTGASTLNLSIGPDFSASVGATFVIINTTTGVSGTFSGLSEGSSIVVGGRKFTISYAGNSDNEVVLTYQQSTPTVTFSVNTAAGGTAMSSGNDIIVNYTSDGVAEQATIWDNQSFTGGVDTGSTVTFSAGSSGSNGSERWQYDAAGDQPTFTVTGSTTLDVTYYDQLDETFSVSTAAGGTPMSASNDITAGYTQFKAGLTQPIYDGTTAIEWADRASTVNFSAQSSGSSSTERWQYNADGDEPTFTVSGATTLDATYFDQVSETFSATTKNGTPLSSSNYMSIS